MVKPSVKARRQIRASRPCLICDYRGRHRVVTSPARDPVNHTTQGRNLREQHEQDAIVDDELSGYIQDYSKTKSKLVNRNAYVHRLNERKSPRCIINELDLSEPGLLVELLGITPTSDGEVVGEFFK